MPLEKKTCISGCCKWTWGGRAIAEQKRSREPGTFVGGGGGDAYKFCLNRTVGGSVRDPIIYSLN